MRQVCHGRAFDLRLIALRHDRADLTAPSV
jgi:hypothetical protein